MVKTRCFLIETEDSVNKIENPRGSNTEKLIGFDNDYRDPYRDIKIEFDWDKILGCKTNWERELWGAGGIIGHWNFDNLLCSKNH